MGALWLDPPPPSPRPPGSLLTTCLTVVSPLTSSREQRCPHIPLYKNGPSCSRPWKPPPGLERQPPKEQVRSDGSPHRGTRTKADFCLNKNGKLVSKKQSAHGKKQFKNIRGWTQAVSKARKALGITGFCAVKKGTPLYAKAREFYN